MNPTAYSDMLSHDGVNEVRFINRKPTRKMTGTYSDSDMTSHRTEEDDDAGERTLLMIGDSDDAVADRHGEFVDTTELLTFMLFSHQFCLLSVSYHPWPSHHFLFLSFPCSVVIQSSSSSSSSSS